MLKAEVEVVQQQAQEAQQALRQARGISSYLKGKQGELEKEDAMGKLALRQANGISMYLKSKNEELKNRLKDAERVEIEAQLALRQAKGVSAYLQKKNASLEKKLEASKTEETAKKAWHKARRNSMQLRTTLLMDETGENDDEGSEEEPASIVSTDDEVEKYSVGEHIITEETGDNEVTYGLSLTDHLYMASLVAMAIGMAMQ